MEVLWHEISILLGQGIPTLIARGFNCIENFQEKRGGRASLDGVESRKFWGFIKRNGLVDLEFFGLRFTWYNNRQGGEECRRGLTILFLGQIGSRCTRDTRFFIYEDLLLIISQC